MSKSAPYSITTKNSITAKNYGGFFSKIKNCVEELFLGSLGAFVEFIVRTKLFQERQGKFTSSTKLLFFGPFLLLKSFFVKPLVNIDLFDLKEHQKSLETTISRLRDICVSVFFAVSLTAVLLFTLGFFRLPLLMIAAVLLLVVFPPRFLVCKMLFLMKKGNLPASFIASPLWYMGLKRYVFKKSSLFQRECIAAFLEDQFPGTVNEILELSLSVEKAI